MATTTDYLNQLIQDRDTLTSNLREKGVDVDDNQTFTDLVPKVLEIQSGGGDSSEYFENTLLVSLTTNGVSRIIKKIPNDINPVLPSDSRNMFKGCTSLEFIPILDALNVTRVDNMFEACSNLKKLPISNIEKTTNINYMCRDCSSLEGATLNVPQVTEMVGTFTNCKKLTAVSIACNQKITNINGMFRNCTILTNIELNVDTSACTSFGETFYSCSKLVNIPQIDTSNATYLNSIFAYCSSIINIQALNASKWSNIQYAFYQMPKLENLGGFVNIGEGYSTTSATNYTYYTIDLHLSYNITHESLINIINNLYDIKTKGCKTQKLQIGSINIAKLTPEEINLAVERGWSVL